MAVLERAGVREACFWQKQKGGGAHSLWAVRLATTAQTCLLLGVSSEPHAVSVTRPIYAGSAVRTASRAGSPFINLCAQQRCEGVLWPPPPYR